MLYIGTMFIQVNQGTKHTEAVPIFTKVRRHGLTRKRRRIVKIRSKWYSQRFVDVA